MQVAISEQLAFKKYSQAVCGYKKLSHWAEILTAGEEFKESVLIHLLMADYWVAYGDFSKAGLCVQEAAKLTTKNQIEILYQKAFECFILKGAFAEALGFFNQILELAPQDLFAMKRAQLMSFCYGDLKSLIGVVQPKNSEELKKLPYYHGMLSFALEENGDFKAAEEVCEEGIKLFPNDPWIHHCLAHIYYFQNRVEEGLKRLLLLSDKWDDLMVFMRCHLWWHIGLLHLDNQDFSSALDLVWDKCWTNCGDKTNVEVQIGVLGFLWKIELYTKKRENKLYDEVLSVISQKDKMPGYFLFDLLYLQALLTVEKAGEAQKFFEKMQSPVTKDYAAGLMELANHRTTGLAMLEKGLKKVHLFMGSTEQCLVFNEHYFWECIRLGIEQRAKSCIDGLLQQRQCDTWMAWSKLCKGNKIHD